jgi:hypothetical protein
MELMIVSLLFQILRTQRAEVGLEVHCLAIKVTGAEVRQAA